MAQLSCPCGRGMVMPDLIIGRRQEQVDFIDRWLTSCGLTWEELTRRDRRPAMVQARREVARYLRGHGWSLPAIARQLHYEDHGTVLHLLRSPDGPRPRVTVAAL